MKFHRLQTLVVGWADQALPERTEAAGFLKLFEELGEVLSNPDDPAEWADVFIMLLDLAARRKINLPQAIMAKLAVLQTRDWVQTSTGTYQHATATASPAAPVERLTRVLYVNGPWDKKEATVAHSYPLATAVGCHDSDAIGHYVYKGGWQGFFGARFAEYTWVEDSDVPF